MAAPIPEFKNEDEEREFWATHDSADYVDWENAEKTISPRMLETILQDEIKSLTNRIVSQFSPSKIFLFGSYASGSPTTDSDLDLCIVTDLQGKRKLDMMRTIRREITPILHRSLDILIYGNDEFAQRSSQKNTLEYKIEKDGTLLYGE